MKFVNASALLFSGNVVIAISSLALGVSTARYLGPESRGMLYLIIQIITIGSLILAGGLGPAYQYYLSNCTFGKSEIFSHLLLQSCLITLLLVLLLAIGDPLYILLGIQDLPIIFIYVIGLGIILNVIVTFINAILMTYGQGVFSLTLLNVGSSLVNTVLFVSCALLVPVDIGFALIAYLIGLLVRVIPSVYIAHRGISIRFSFDWITMNKRLFKYGASSFLFNLAVVMVFRIDTFIVNKLVGLEELGKYAVAVTFAEMVLILPSTIGTALFAHFPTLPSAAQVELLKKTCRVVIAITGTICMLLAVISPMLVTFLVGDQYVGAIAPLRLLIPGVVAMATAYILANYFAGTGHPILGAVGFGFGLIAKIGLNYLLVPPLGIIGAALATSVAYIATVVSLYLLLRQKQRVAASSLFMPTSEDIQMIISHVKEFIVRICRATRQ
jgi:O-antigen/teichoic acid export membrane protein